MRFIIGPLIIIAGFIMIKYAVQIANFTGMIDFAERYLTGGLAGTYSLYKIIGFLLCVLGLCYLFGLFNFLPSSFGPTIPTGEVQSYLNIVKFI